MHYLKIVLDGYKRLSLNHINHIEVMPQSKIQLILGSNGAGKSSLVKELTPLPADPKDYLKDGYKIVELLHNNSHYLLKNTFATTGNKYSFLKDTEELNPGGTMTTYKELVRQEFNITQDVHDLMTGYDNFHSMSVGERRSWFTKISDTDYTYAISFFRKLGEQQRDIAGAIRSNQLRIVQESQKLLTDEEEVTYRKEIKLLNGMLAYLLETKTPIQTTSSEVTSYLTKCDARLTELSTEIIRYKSKFSNDEGFTSVNDIDLCIIENQTQASSLAAESHRLHEQIDKQQKTITALKDANLASFSDIDKTIDSLGTELATTKRQLSLNIKIDDAKDSYRALLSVFDSVTDIFSQLEENKDKRYSRDTYNAALDKQKVLLAIVTTGEQQLTHYLAKKKELEHFRDHNELECPKCMHKWNKGYSEAEYNKVNAILEDVCSKLVIFKKDTVEHDSLVERIRTYLELYRAYSSITQSWVVLKPLWDYIYQSSIIFEQPKQLNKLLETYRMDLQVAMKIEEISKRFKDTVELKEMLSKNQETSISSLLDESEKLNDYLYLTNEQLSFKKVYVKKLNDYREYVINIDMLSKEVELLLGNRKLKTDELMVLHKRAALNQSIEAVQIELNKKEQTISMIDIQKAIVNNLQAQIFDDQEKADVLKLAIKELSPSEGLIAKGLTGFINHFLSQMNSFIKKVWLYPLELIPIVPNDNDGIDLDYRFSVLVNDDAVIPDVAKTSSGMKEIIDLAFRIVSMQYLHLSNAPIVLDEFAKTLDKAHRESANNVIRDISINSNFSQIFIVSHYEESYGSFNNCDIIVLHDANIPVVRNGAFNKHVIIR